MSLGIDVRIYNASSLKPVDDDAILRAGKETKLLITIEDHTVLGGLGGAVAESLSQSSSMPKLIRIGIEDDFGESGTPDDLYDKHGLSKAKISERVKSEWQKFRQTSL
jgi:transketolase